LTDNPLLAPWPTTFGEPPFSKIKLEHLRPAFDAALAEWRAELEAIKADPQAPNFDNTILALERSGETLDRVERVFYHLVGTASSDEIEAIQREIQPRLARAGADMLLDDALFARVEAVHAELAGLDEQARRLVERRRLAFQRAGAGLAPEKKQRLAAIAERLAALNATFSQNVLGDEKAFALVLESEADLAGLPDAAVAAAAEAAKERGHPGKFVITLSRGSVEPFLQFSARRDLREQVWRGFVARGAGERDNAPVMSEIVSLRAEMAALLGYASYADYKLADTMAQTPGAALDLMRSVWAPARAAALEEAKALQTMIAEDGGNFELKPWDWRFYAEKRRQALYDFDESAIRAHLPLENVLAAAFDVARRLFGLSFQERFDVDLPHADARAFEVRDAQGRHVALFIGDYFARPEKHSGAWMSALRDQHRLDGGATPIVVNVLNAARGGEGGPTLLSHDEARTLFHEFGHALHGMLSDVTYPYLSGTNVARDFVELPSQLYEHWLDRPEVLSQFARHHETGAPIAPDLVARMTRARTYGQALGTVEFLASAFTDMKAHGLGKAEGVDVRALEAEGLRELGMPPQIAPRHGAPHFQHIFAGDGYSAGYYSYLWSEVLDADAFEAFVESGDIFDPALAERLRRYVYASGNTRAPDELYAAFRGRAPDASALLRKRGFA
jgi:peptidyl-dipeptidase Dcp